MKYYITEELKIQTGSRDYQFTCDGCHIVLIVNGQVNFVLYNMDNTIVKDIHTLLPINGTAFPNIKSEYYINPGTYKLNIDNTQGKLQYQKQVDSNNTNYKLLDDVSTDISTGLANNAYPVNGRLCTVEDMFAEYHENNRYYNKGYYLAEHVKDKLVTYDMAIKGLSIKLLSVYGYETLKDDKNPASKIYQIEPNIPEEQQQIPPRYFNEILNAIKEWTRKKLSDTYDVSQITEDTNIYDILSRTITFRKSGETPIIEDRVLSTILNNIKNNTPLTDQEKQQIFDTLIGNDVQESGLPCSLWDLLNYIGLEYQFTYNGNQKCTLFPNQYSYRSGISNTMTFINAQGVIQEGTLQYEFTGHGPVTGNNQIIKYADISLIERNSNDSASFTIKHSTNPYNNINNKTTDISISFYDSNGNSVLTVRKLYDILYVPVWKQIISDLVYNTVKIFTTPFNGSQVYNIPNGIGRDESIKDKKIVRICDLANITFELYGVSDVAYPWYIGGNSDGDIETDIGKYIKKRLYTLDAAHPETNKIETLLPLASQYTYYNAHTFSPEWKKLRGSNTLNIEYVQYTKEYTLKSNINEIKIFSVTNPLTYLQDPSANKTETHNALNKLGLTLNNNPSTGIYGGNLSGNDNFQDGDDRVDDDRYPGRNDDGNNNSGDPHNPTPTTPTRTDKQSLGNQFERVEHRVLISPDEINQHNLRSTDKIKVEYYTVLPTSPNLTPNIKNLQASMSLYDNTGKAITHNTHNFTIKQYPRQYLVLFIFYKPLQGDSNGAYENLTTDDVYIEELYNNFKIDLLSKGNITQNTIVNYPAFYQLFNIKYAYKNLYNMTFNININKTTEELKKIRYKVGVYFKPIDAKGDISLEGDMRYVYDISTYINNDKTLKIDGSELSKYNILVDPTLSTLSGVNNYNKISINGELPQESYTCDMTPLWSNITSKVTIKLTNNQ